MPPRYRLARCCPKLCAFPHLDLDTCYFFPSRLTIVRHQCPPLSLFLVFIKAYPFKLLIFTNRASLLYFLYSYFALFFLKGRPLIAPRYSPLLSIIVFIYRFILSLNDYPPHPPQDWQPQSITTCFHRIRMSLWFYNDRPFKPLTSTLDSTATCHDIFSDFILSLYLTLTLSFILL